VKPDKVLVTVRFVTIMDKYSGKREIEMELPCDPVKAVDLLITRFNIPWKNNLEKRTRIFINKELYGPFINSGKCINAKDTIAFIPISGGG